VFIAGCSAASVLLGAALACRAERHPGRREAIEGAAGALIIVGLALLGFGLECALGGP
jgi:hypothetical protein